MSLEQEVQKIVSQVSDTIDFDSEVQKIKSLVEKQNMWRKRECINLIASENVTSPLVDAVYASDFSHRYAEGDPYKRYYNGTKYVDELESYATDLAKKLFSCSIANVQLISGTVANIAAFNMFTRPGDIVLTNATASGGHISHNLMGAAGILSTSVMSFPTTPDGFHIDVDATTKIIKRKYAAFRRLSAMFFGCSLFLFPQPVKELSDIAREFDVKTVYDAAHVFGLIAGKQFQDPLREGALVVTSSTHKTFFGPQGGIILSDLSEEEWKKYKSAVFPGVVSNHHLHRIPALAIALLEFTAFGQEYAKQVTANAKALAQALHKKGFNVLCEEFGFTESHQFAVDATNVGGGKAAADKLEESNIIVNKNLLPGDTSVINPRGIRIGVQEMTRWGMKENEMQELAEFFKKILLDNQNARQEVTEFRNKFQKIYYTFEF